MEQFHLIIQKTTTGLTVEYASPGIDPQHSNVIKTLEDERAFATQIVKESDVYSLEITDHYRIYSLIVIDSDKFGRSGYYQFKLYGPRDNHLENFYSILQEIKTKYNEDTSNKPYESILSSILLTQNNSLPNYISVKRNNKKYYSFYDEANLDSLKKIFKEKGSYLISKLYALNKSKAYKEDVIQSVGLLPFSLDHFREVIISNPDRVLKELFLNNEILTVNTFEEEFKILVEPNDVLTYSTTDNKTIQSIPGSFTEIKRKPLVQPTQSNPQRLKKSSRFQENGVYILALVIMIGGAIFGYYKDPSIFGLLSNNQPSHVPNNEKSENITKDSIPPMFCKYHLQDSLNFVPVREGLDHYIFSFVNNSWYFKNKMRKKTYNEFNKNTVENLQIKDSTPFSPEDQVNFIEALERESGHKLNSVIVEDPKDQSKKTSSSSKTRSKKTSEKSIEEAKKDDTNNTVDPLGGVKTGNEGN